MPFYLAVIITLLLLALLLLKDIYTWYLFFAIFLGVLSHLQKISKMEGKWILNRKKFIDYFIVLLLSFFIIAIVLIIKGYSFYQNIPYIILFIIAAIFCFLLAMEKDS